MYRKSIYSVNFVMLSMFDALSNKNRTRIIASIVVTLLSPTFVPRFLHQSLLKSPSSVCQSVAFVKVDLFRFIK